MSKSAKWGIIVLGLGVVVALAWANRLELVLKAVSIASSMRQPVGPNQPIRWDNGADPSGRLHQAGLTRLTRANTLGHHQPSRTHHSACYISPMPNQQTVLLIWSDLCQGSISHSGLLISTVESEGRWHRDALPTTGHSDIRGSRPQDRAPSWSCVV